VFVLSASSVEQDLLAGGAGPRMPPWIERSAKNVAPPPRRTIVPAQQRQVRCAHPGAAAFTELYSPALSVSLCVAPRGARHSSHYARLHSVLRDFGPDFELRRRHSTLERGQELGQTRRAVDASMR